MSGYFLLNWDKFINLSKDRQGKPMEDTIAAISTPFGEGGIGIIRISGGNSLSILNNIFVPASGKPLKNRMMTYGHIFDDNKNVIDEVMAVFMKAPGTYTVEDVAEVNCHGGTVPVRRILSLILSKGARLAEPGEFTKRAFLNGRLDLTQAEAVVDLVSAKAEKAFDVAIGQLEGSLSDRIKECRNNLTDILVYLAVNIDYPDEDIEEITYEKLESELLSVVTKINRLLESHDTGRILKEGLRVAIIGKPNVGKSSLMNALLRESRAIVTDIPGTTRDTIEEDISIRGIPIILIDTAGIRETDDKIEAIGIERSKNSFNKADLTIMVMDGSCDIESSDLEILEKLDPKKSIILLNKNDLKSRITADDIDRAMEGKIISGKETQISDDVSKKPCRSDDVAGNFCDSSVERESLRIGIHSVSLKKIDDILYIEDILLNKINAGNTTQKNSPIITNIRHKDLLERAERAISDAIASVQLPEPLEIVEIDVKEAYLALGELLGEEAADDILEKVFSRFCLGK